MMAEVDMIALMQLAHRLQNAQRSYSHALSIAALRLGALGYASKEANNAQEIAVRKLSLA